MGSTREIQATVVKEAGFSIRSARSTLSGLKPRRYRAAISGTDQESTPVSSEPRVSLSAVTRDPGWTRERLKQGVYQRASAAALSKREIKQRRFVESSGALGVGPVSSGTGVKALVGSRDHSWDGITDHLQLIQAFLLITLGGDEDFRSDCSGKTWKERPWL